MIYALKRVEAHPVYKLQEAADHFMRHGLDQPTFSDACLPAWFQPVLAASEELRADFRRVFDYVSAHGQACKSALQNYWNCLENVKLLCENHGSTLIDIKMTHAALFDHLRALFERLYKSTLATEGFKSACGGRFEDLYVAIRNLGQRVCPFCGLHNYEDRNGGARSSFDHYLPRKHYPVLSVNFENLVPMCSACNEAPNKGVKDVLFSDVARTRRRVVYFPYNPVGGIEVESRCEELAKPGARGKWAVIVRPAVGSEKPQVQAWKSIFRIETRYSARISESEDAWIKKFLIARRYTSKPTVAVLKEDFLNYSINLARPECRKEMVEAQLEASFFRALAESAPASQLEGIAVISLSYIPVIQPKN